MRVEGITDLPAFNNLCSLPCSLLSPVTQKYQGIWHLPYPFTQEDSRPSRFHSCPSTAPETAGDACPPAPLVIPYPSLTRAFGSFERQACEVRHDRKPFWDFTLREEVFVCCRGAALQYGENTEARHPSTRERRAFEQQAATKQGRIRTTKKAATEVTALNMHLFALPYLAKPMARRSRMTVTRIWPG